MTDSALIQAPSSITSFRIRLDTGRRKLRRLACVDVLVLEGEP